MNRQMRFSLRTITILILLLWLPAFSQPKPRGRDLGIPFQGSPGPYNAITDVKGLEVGHTTLIQGDGELVVGTGPVRTGVTAILPQGKRYGALFAAWYSLNGNGEMTGTTWVEESGFLTSPILITNTHSVGVVRDAVVQWLVSEPISSGQAFALPVVAETSDRFLNDMNGFHVSKEHAVSALNKASSGPVEEGGVGGGTGMICHRFKGGIGTSSRRLSPEDGGYTVGVLVQANYGDRESLTIAGVPVGREIRDLMPTTGGPSGEGSIIVVVATDAPLLPHQLKRLARRVPLGIAKVGGLGTNSSGDIFIAFSTANQGADEGDEAVTVRMLPNRRMNHLFLATVEATEEAIVNALVAGETMTGINGNKVYALPQQRLREVLRKYNRLNE